MPADIYGNNAILAELLLARNPEWTVQDNSLTGVPSTVNHGVTLMGSNDEGRAPKTHVRISVRRNIHRREARVKVTTADYTGDYRLVVGGSQIDYTADAQDTTPADILEGLGDEVNGLSGYSSLVETDPFDDDADVLVIYKDDGTTFTIDFSIPSGTGVLAVEADSESASCNAYCLKSGTGTGNDTARWGKVPSYQAVAVSNGNYHEVWDTLGMSTLYVDRATITAVSGNGSSVTNYCEVAIGPARLESDPP